MTVRIDDLKVWGNAKHRCFKNGSAHLTADTLDELHAFAARLGLKREWFQDRVEFGWGDKTLETGSEVQ